MTRSRLATPRVAAVLAALSLSTFPGASAQSGGRKIALIIAISDYGTPPSNPVTGSPLRPYRALNAHNDIPLVRGALELQGFRPGDIQVLRDADADAEGIREALRRLVRGTGRGDVVVVHYSGHGHRLTNDNPEADDETDGYDEVLVPYGAPDDFYDGYDGSLHVRDDELGDVVASLRERAGPTGSVTVFLDACYTGTATRGDSELPARGSERPLGPPSQVLGAGTSRGDPAEEGTGVDRPSAGGTRGGEAGLAPYAVFSAASQRQVAYETWDVDGATKVGSLSYALARTLPVAEPGSTNRTLFAAITRSLSGKVVQNPQMEGMADAQLFSNRLTQQAPYVVVGGVDEAGVRLVGGSLLGLNPGTQLLVHIAGTARPDAARALATLRVRQATATVALADVLSGEVAESTAGGWAFVSARTHGDLALKVRLDESLAERDRTGLGRVFSGTGIIELVSGEADVVVADRRGLPEARSTADGLSLGTGAVDVVRSVEDFARNRYLRMLSFAAPDLTVELDFAPARIERDALGRATGCAPALWDPGAHAGVALGGGQWRMSPGDAYRLQARNTGQRRAFVAVVDLLPGGGIKVLRPRENEAPSSYEVEVDATMDLGCYQIADEVGHEVLKLFATSTPQDLRAMFETRGTRGASGNMSELASVLATTYGATRSAEVARPDDTATTRDVLIRVQSN